MLDDYITYNGKTNQNKPIYIKNEIQIPTAQKRIIKTTVAGRDGTLTEFDGYDNITITVNFLVRSNNPYEQLQFIKEWLLSEGDNELRWNRISGGFYKVKNVSLSAYQRTAKNKGIISASFECEPYEYRDTGKTMRSFTSSTTLTNELVTSHPVIEITGNGNCTLAIEHNGITKTMSVLVASKTTIDTDRMLCIKNGEIVNSYMTGNYEDFYLKNGKSKITITSGFTGAIYPNWRKL